jgi:hypothetical protein
MREQHDIWGLRDGRRGELAAAAGSYDLGLRYGLWIL